jgi:glutamine amidotransferase-like uncharacterized protein
LKYGWEICGGDMMKKTILILIIMFLSNRLYSKDIWIYSDSGTWTDGIIAFEQFLDYMGESHKRIYAKDLNALNNFDNAKAICFPGGYAYDYKIALSYKSIEILRDYVASGGSYIGICAGAFFASSLVVWEGVEYSYPLELFKGKAIGSIHKIAPWDNYNMTKIAINPNNPIAGTLNTDLSVLYYGGPYFESTQMTFDTVAVWSEYNDKAGIINFNFQNGKVLLIGPHLEIETSSDRDSTDFANEFDDIETDWIIFKSMMNWLFLPTSVDRNSEGMQMNPIISPNPAADYIEISLVNKGLQPYANSNEVAIYNMLGERVLAESIHPMTTSHRMNVSNLTRGIYFIKIGVMVEKFVKR